MYPDSGGIESHRGEGDRNRRIGCILVQVEFIPSGQHGAEKDYIGLKLRLEFSSRKIKKEFLLGIKRPRRIHSRNYSVLVYIHV